MIKITFENGETHTIINDETAIETPKELQAIFDGHAAVNWENGMDLEDILFGIDETEDMSDYTGKRIRITGAEWVDPDPETNVHEYVLDFILPDIDKTFAVAEGSQSVAKPKEWLDKYWHGFHECVTKEINLEGLEFVFGNNFDLHNLINFVVREITREYLREHNLY